MEVLVVVAVGGGAHFDAVAVEGDGHLRVRDGGEAKGVDVAVERAQAQDEIA